MSDKIKVSLRIDPECEQTQVVITAAEKTEMVENIIRAVEQCTQGDPTRLTVYDGDRVVLLKQEEIIRVYVENRMLTVCTASGRYRSRLTLKDFEEMLDGDIFVRVSRFEVVNLKKVKSFDMSIAGTIGITFEDGEETWVARRCVGNIRKKLSVVSKGGQES